MPVATWFVGLFHKKPDYLELCENKVRSIEVLVHGGNLLNRRQCQDLSKKLLKTILNIREVVPQSGAQADGLSSIMRPNIDGALEHLYRSLEKAMELVRNCGEPDWCAAAVFQCQNENAFREILLEVGLCYNAIYEEVKSTNADRDVKIDDLRESSEFLPATESEILEDQQELQKRLEDQVEQLDDHSLPAEEVLALKRSLAKYLLVKMQCTSEQSMATTLDKSSEILWQKDTEPPGTWGSSHFLGGGATDGAVCRTHWLGIPCAKKAYHSKEYENLFLKEAGILAHLNHPCIVNFICCSNGEAEGDRFIAMELMEKSLSKVIEDQKNKHFSLPVLVDIIAQIAHGMWYLHNHGVAHRDLKPQNVVVKTMTYPETTLENHFSIKLVDFGESKTKVEVLKSNVMTYRGIGTTMYRAPEAHPSASSGGIGRVNWFKADVYSFAMTCAHILSLETPFQGGKKNISLRDDALYDALMNGRRPDLPEDCPAELARLLKDCWNTLRHKRPPFKDICRRLEIFKHKVLTGSISKTLEGKSLDFIEEKIEAHSSLQKVFINQDEEEDEGVEEVVASITCTFGHELKLLQELPYRGSCNVCGETVEGKAYHCHVCQFDAHLDCAEIKDKVNVFFHHHSLHLLVQNYYSDDPETTCRVCEESVQDSEWVYRCERCDFDVHAICTKQSSTRMRGEFHSHPLALTQCAPRKSLSCRRCNDSIKGYTWRYICIHTSRCGFDLHPLCAIRPGRPFCVFGNSDHRLYLSRGKTNFVCGRCGAPGISWSYWCGDCDVVIHPDCVDGMNQEKIGRWNGAYEKFMIENGSKDDYTKMNMILELLDDLPFKGASDHVSSSSSSSSPPPPLAVITDSLDANFDDANVQRQTEERIHARKMAAKESRQKLRENLPEMVESLERMILGLRSSENIIIPHDEVQIADIHEKLKRKLDFLKEQAAVQRQSKMSRGPRIAVFFKNKRDGGEIVGREILTSLEADMKGVCYALLCEKPGHEHIVPGTTRIYSQNFGELAEKLEPLLTPGLQIVMRAASTLELTSWDSVTLPCLEPPFQWDLRAIRPEVYATPTLDKEKVEVQERAQNSAAEWFRNNLEDRGRNILKSKGLQRIRFKKTEDCEFPKYRRGTLAWLCTDHVKSGVEDGTLVSYPLKYFDVDDDHQLRCPPVMVAGM